MYWLSFASAYLFAIFLLALRTKVSHKAIRPFKFLILALLRSDRSTSRSSNPDGERICDRRAVRVRAARSTLSS
ncbi:MAG: hypothetical protein MZU97_10365 [Bacillus subtilis]|nr:hypothetical protein [Bacillus subtilis]